MVIKYKDYTLNDIDIEILKSSCSVCRKFKKCNYSKLGKCLQHTTLLKFAYIKFKRSVKND